MPPSVSHPATDPLITYQIIDRISPPITMMEFGGGAPTPIYVRKKVIVKDVDKRVDVNRNIYYGTHHLVRDRHRTRSFARDSRRR